jgi:alpha-glucosidase (family GH31 glycosyl hydrolase)
MLGMLASLWAIVMILASNVETSWKILFDLVAVATLSQATRALSSGSQSCQTMWTGDVEPSFPR